MSKVADKAADERTMLSAMLLANRQELLATVEGLTEEQVRRRLVPSLTTLISLIAHAARAAQRPLDPPPHDRGTRPSCRPRRHPPE